MYKVDTQDLEEITKFLDKINTPMTLVDYSKRKKKAQELSKMIKDKYTEIKPHYEK